MTDKEFADERIVRKVQKGDSELFRLIIERYQDNIFSMGIRFFYNRDDAADFCQEVFLKAFNNISSYREIAPFRFWLAKLAYNHGINMKKSGQETASSDCMEIISTEGLPEELHIYNEIKTTLLEEINRLPERYRICLDFYFFLGLKYIEISEITGYPVNTIKSDVFRAKNILRQKLKGTIAGDYDEM